MIVNALFLNLLSLLVIAGDTFTAVTATALASNASPDYSSKERQAKCVRGECQWECPDDWCWVAHGEWHRVDGGRQGYGWAWVKCNTADDCKENAINNGPSCKHSGWNIFSSDGWGYPYSLNCPWISPEHQAAIDEENRKKDEENRRRTIKCFKPELTPDEVEKAVKDHYHPEVYYNPQVYRHPAGVPVGYGPDGYGPQAPKPPAVKAYRTAECASNGWCKWSCPDRSCWVASKHTEAEKISWEWLKCKTVDDCKADGDARVCRGYDTNISNDPLDAFELSCPFDEEARMKQEEEAKKEAEKKAEEEKKEEERKQVEKKQDDEVKKWMKCAAPDASAERIERDLKLIKVRDFRIQHFTQHIRQPYYL